MALTDSLAQASAALKVFAAEMAAISVAPVQVEVAATPGGDRAEAEAIKRGQKPETVAAMRKALEA